MQAALSVGCEAAEWTRLNLKLKVSEALMLFTNSDPLQTLRSWLWHHSCIRHPTSDESSGSDIFRVELPAEAAKTTRNSRSVLWGLRGLEGEAERQVQ